MPRVSASLRTVLFVCTGNTCRSPLAEGIARGLVVQGIEGIEPTLLVVSAGVFAAAGVPTSAETVSVLAARGYACDGVSTPLTVEMIDRADLVLGMTQSHVEAARHIAPDTSTPIELLDPEGDIDDPLGMGSSTYEDLAKHLEAVIPARLSELLSPCG